MYNHTQRGYQHTHAHTHTNTHTIAIIAPLLVSHSHFFTTWRKEQVASLEMASKSMRLLQTDPSVPLDGVAERGAGGRVEADGPCAAWYMVSEVN